jgi:hypothetical protein
MGKRRCAYSVLVGNTEGKRPPGILRRIWEGNTKMDLQESGTAVIWLRIRTLVNAVMNIRVPKNAGNFLTS